MKLFLLSAIVLLCSLALPTYAQVYGSKYYPKDAGYYISSSPSDFYDNDNNSTGNGFGDNIGEPNDDVWYSFTIGSTTTLNISTFGSDFDTYLHILDQNGYELESNDDNGPLCVGNRASIRITLSPGTYYAAVEGYGENSGNIALMINNADLNYDVQSALLGAINAGSFGGCGSRTFMDYNNNSSYMVQNKYGHASGDIVYRFTVDATAQINISLCGSNFDTYLHLLNGSGVEIESNDDNGPLCAGSQSSIQTTLSPGWYYVIAEGFSFSCGDIVTSISSEMPECTDNIVPFSYSSQPVDPETRTLNASLPVGSTAGQASVSLSGAATYSIPIFSSPGTSGMQPNISLVYSSQSGNGIAGYRWNISGLGSISRVPHTIYHDGDVKGVDFVNDRFALDGQRLINFTGSTYGADLTSYYTEVFNGSKIVSHGNLGGAPVWFEVFNKDGSIVEYGRTDDSRFKSQLTNQATVSWNINKITDANGNFIQFIYHRGDIECYIAEIKYTGNYSDSNNPLEPYNSVKFYYGNRTDKSTFFVGGSRVENNVLLDHIDIRAESNLVKSYKLKYYFDTYSKLNEIEEYGKDNRKYNSTIIQWGEHNSNIAVSTLPALIRSRESTDKDQKWFSSDINGDGLSDLVFLYRATGLNQLYLDTYLCALDNSGTPTFNNVSKCTPVRDIIDRIPASVFQSASYLNLAPPISFADLRGDGTKVSIYPVRNNATNTYWFEIEGADMSEETSQIGTEMPAYNFADINNDGVDEIVTVGRKVSNGTVDVKICYSKALLNFTWKTFTLNCSSDPKDIFVADFNGDGLKDIAIVTANGVILCKNNGGSVTADNYATVSFTTQSTLSTFNADYSTIRPGDFNGDGLPDFILNEHCNSNWKLAINNGNWGFDINPLSNFTAVEEDFTEGNDDKENCIVTDYNNDGKSDVILVDAVFKDPSHWYENHYGRFDKTNVTWYTSTGTGFNVSKTFTTFDENYTFSKFTATGDFDGDAREELFSLGSDLYNGNAKANLVYFHSSFNSNFEADLVKTVTDGLGKTTKLNYLPFTHNTTSDNKQFYEKGTGACYPISDLQAPLYLAYRLQNDDGMGGFSTTTYSYKDALIHKTGKGFLGFKVITSIDPSGIIHSNSSTLDNTYYFLKPDDTKTEFPAGTLLNESNSVYSVTSIANAPAKVICPFPKEVINLDYLSGTKIKNETDLDDFGNPKYSKISYFNKHTDTDTEVFGYTNTVFTNYVNAGSWCSSKPMDVQLTQNRKDETNFTKKGHFEYDSKGNTTISIEFNELLKKVTTTYTDFNRVGKPQTTTISANSVDPRVSKIGFDDKFRYVTHTENPENLTSDATYDPAFGNKLTTTDANGLVTTTEYDGFGTPLQITDPLSVWSKNELKWYTGGDKPNVIFYSESTSNNGPTERKYFDKLGRALYVSHEDFSGRNVFTKTQYNSLGLVEKVYEPYFENSSPTLFTESTYDEYNRLQTVKSPSGVVLTYINPTPGQPGLKSEVSNSATGIKTSQTLDALGKVNKATDPGGEIQYSYYSNGNPKEIIAPDGHKITMAYDEYGRQTSLSDPDAGLTGYVYNAYGELIEQTDANNNKFTMIYDKLGRLLSKTGTKVNLETVKIANEYISSTGTSNKGLLSKTTYLVGTPNLIETSSFCYYYDNYSRIARKTIHADQDYNYIYTYDSKGNLATYQFPSGFTISHTYDKGYMKRVSNNADGSSIFAPKDYTVKGQLRWWDNGAGDIIHNFNEFDQYGFPTDVLCGTNMGTWNIQNLETHFNTQTGNLEYRKDKNFMVSGSYLTENFTYDNVHQNRLASWLVNGQPSSYTATYEDKNGNILTKSDVTSAGNEYIYNADDKPHAVRSITNPLLTPAEAQQDITYNRFNKVEEIKHINQGLRLNIFYGPDEQRIKSEFYENDVLTKTKLFIGGDYEVEKLPNGSERRIHYLPGGGLYVSNEVGTGQMYYVQSDYQGNWNSVTNATGTVFEHYSFDPWGRRRNHIDWSFNNVPSTFLFDRGYTGHEMLDAFGLINMNGRVYDPAMARFLSPDNYVQAPDNSQGFNRYSYCLNNPLMYTDPSGEFFWVIPNISWSQNGGLSVGVSFEFGLPGAASFQVGVGYNLNSGQASVYGGATFMFNTVYASYSQSGGLNAGYTAGASFFSGFPISSNYATAGFNYNFKNGSFSGNISAWEINEDGLNFNPSVSAMILPEQSTNFLRGRGFRNNDKVLSNFVTDGKYQEALDYFGFEGKYNPDNKLFKTELGQSASGITDPKTGEIFYTSYAFSGYDKLNYIAAHEERHSQNVKSGRYANSKVDFKNLVEERNTYLMNYKNEGLYPKSGINSFNQVNSYGLQYGLTTLFQKQWWHFIYRIPRKF